MANSIQSVGHQPVFELVENARNEQALVIHSLGFALNALSKPVITIKKFVDGRFSLTWVDTKFSADVSEIEKIVKDLIAQNQIPSGPIDELGLLQK